ncbi:hypothetical protein VR44_19110 [Streptomyces katrae]|uniref:Uncharacterized protein n=1 Tax=Streptomyces katrae TaxID=68223 RepID=A0A0F4JB88_9ACTN|nr:hypothetical protein VR44_19110 [Streptomyces katrae]
MTGFTAGASDCEGEAEAEADGDEDSDGDGEAVPGLSSCLDADAEGEATGADGAAGAEPECCGPHAVAAKATAVARPSVRMMALCRCIAVPPDSSSCT